MVDWSGGAIGPGIAPGPTGSGQMAGATAAPTGSWNENGLTIGIYGGNNPDPVAPGTMDMEGSLVGGPNHPGITGGVFGGIMQDSPTSNISVGGPVQDGDLPGHGAVAPTNVGNPMGYGMGQPTGMPGNIDGGSDPIFIRMQGLTQQQKDFLLSNPQALNAFNREYNRIMQSGQGGQVGIGEMRDVDYTHGTYNVPPRGLISQGTVDRGGAA